MSPQYLHQYVPVCRASPQCHHSTYISTCQCVERLHNVTTVLSSVRASVYSVSKMSLQYLHQYVPVCRASPQCHYSTYISTCQCVQHLHTMSLQYLHQYVPVCTASPQCHYSTYISTCQCVERLHNVTTVLTSVRASVYSVSTMSPQYLHQYVPVCRASPQCHYSTYISTCQCVQRLHNVTTVLTSVRASV